MVKADKKTRLRYFTPADISLHNTSDDLWVSFLSKVYDLTPLCKQYRGDVLLKPILMFGGKDISHWFDPKTNDLRRYIDPVSGCLIPYTPHGIFIHVPPPFPSSDWANDFGLPWWKDVKYCIGALTAKTRAINVVNTLTSQVNKLEVCAEDPISDILERYLKYNAHARSYTWKYMGEVLDMDKNLEENGVKDDDEAFYELGMDSGEFSPSLHLYFNDDLTEA